MGSHKIGLFRLIDPPDGQTEAVRQVLDAVDYPWHRIYPAVNRDPDRAVIIRWLPDMRQSNSGEFHGHVYEIKLSTRYTNWRDGVDFVLAHELGHLVDRATFDTDTKTALSKLLHDSPETYRRDEQMLNDEVIEYAHVHDHVARWRGTGSGDHYYLHQNEAYADLFVAAFAPSIWEGHYPRFTHWTTDLQAVRDITLRRPIVPFTDIEDNVHRDAIEWAAGQGLLDGYPDGRFRPNEPITRGQFCTIKYREHLASQEPPE